MESENGGYMLFCNSKLALKRLMAPSGPQEFILVMGDLRADSMHRKLWKIKSRCSAGFAGFQKQFGITSWSWSALLICLERAHGDPQHARPTSLPSR